MTATQPRPRRTKLQMCIDLFNELNEAEMCEAADQIGKRIETLCRDKRRFYGGLLRRFCGKQQSQ